MNCPKCGQHAYVGFSTIECTNNACVYYKPTVVEVITPKEALDRAFSREGTDIRYFDGWVLLYAMAFAIMKGENPDVDFEKYKGAANKYAHITSSRGGIPDEGFYEFMKTT
jgi:hypothetical protein